MTRRRIHRFRMARGRTVTAAVIRRAQMRAAFEHPARYLDLRQPRVVARGLRSAARIFRNAAGLRRVGFMLLRIPIRRPFPGIADHVVQAVAIRRECSDRRCALEPILAKVLSRKFTLPGVGHMLAAGRELVAPGKLGAVKTAARSELPFRLGRQILAGPFGVSQRVRERDVHDRMIVEPIDVAVRSVGMLPICALQEGPPLTPVAKIDRPRRRRKNKRPGIEHVRQRAGIVFGIGRNSRQR